MFVLHGEYNGKKASLGWDNGEVRGTKSAVDAYSRMQADNPFVHIPTMGSFDNTDNQDELATFVRFHEIIHPVTSHDGDLPQMPEIPDGAVS